MSQHLVFGQGVVSVPGCLACLATAAQLHLVEGGNGPEPDTIEAVPV